MPDGVACLERLGVVLAPGEFAGFEGIRYVDGAVRAEAAFAVGRGLGIRRTVLHDALRRRAEELGVELRWGTAISGLRPDGVETGAGRVRGRFTVAADGRNSPASAPRGPGTAGRDSGARIGVRRHFEVAPWSRFVEVHWTDGCEAYVTPAGENLVGIALLSDDRVVRFDDRIKQFPELMERLGPADAASRDRGAGPFGQRCRRAVRGRLALVGDAAWCLDPITGEGLSLAFHEAHAVVESILARGLEEYAQAHRRLRRVPAVLTWTLTQAAAQPVVRRRMMRALASSDNLFGRLLAIGSGGQKPRLMGPYGALGLAWELGRRGFAR